MDNTAEYEFIVSLKRTVMDTLSAMRSFLRIADSGSVSGAARLLGRSKAAISKQLAELEAHLGVQLLLRTTRQVRLTDLGRAYYDRCQQVLADIDALESLVQQNSAAPRGVLRVAGPQTFAELQLTAVIHAFVLAHPGLSLHLTLTDSYVDLIDGDIDVAIRVGQLNDSSLVARRLAGTTILACAAPAYLAQRGVPLTPDALSGHALVVDSNFRSPASWRFQRGEQSWTIRAQGHLHVNSAVMVRDLLLAGSGIGLCPEFVVREALARGELVEVLADFRAYELGVYAVYPQRRHLAERVRLFVDFLADSFARSGR